MITDHKPLAEHEAAVGGLRDELVWYRWTNAKTRIAAHMQ